MKFPNECVLSSLCAALASCMAKVAFDWSEKSYVSLLANFILSALPVLPYPVVLWPLRVCCIICTITLNSCMLKFYVDALRNWSALQATTLNFAANSIISALFGVLFFGEVLSLQWWLGASLMIIGVYFISSDPVDVKKEGKGKKET
jgi:drug/metabolite transporter (DMT)-like permease